MFFPGVGQGGYVVSPEEILFVKNERGSIGKKLVEILRVDVMKKSIRNLSLTRGFP
jgi:hypothetical protein